MNYNMATAPEYKLTDVSILTDIQYIVLFYFVLKAVNN